MYWRHGERLIVVGSNSGRDQQPRNLRANPKATAQAGRDKMMAIAREATGGERERLWRSVTDTHPLFAECQRRADRSLPVFVRTPVLTPEGQ